MANQGGGNAAGDIEEQLSTDNASEAASTNSDHPNTRASPIQDDDSSFKDFLANPIPLLRILFTTTFIPSLLWCTLMLLFLFLLHKLSILFCIIISPVAFLYSVAIAGETNFLVYERHNPINLKEEDNKEVSHMKQKKVAVRVKIHRLTILTAVRTGLLVLLWMAINLNVENLRRVTVLGSLLWKWSLLAAIILLAYPILTCLLNAIFLFILQEILTRKQLSSVQYYVEGIAEGLILALYFTFLLLAWLLCVDTTNAQLHRHGTLALVSLLVGGVLYLLRSSVLLWWRTTLIYNKYKVKILSAGCYLYFNLLLTGQNTAYDELLDWLDWDSYTPLEFVPADPKSEEIKDHKERPNRRKILPIEEYMLKKDVNIKNVHVVATCLTTNFELSLTEDDDIPDIIPDLRRNILALKGEIAHPGRPSPPARRECERRPRYSLTEVEHPAGDVCVNLLTELLQLETSMEDPLYAEFEKWMVDGPKYSYAVGNRIDGAFQVMRILSRVMTTFLVAVVIIVWLFITGLATTKVVVALASIFLGLSFVFGDACKTFFQGVIFSFVTHPFDVADGCIIDGKELKVKKINILTTSFFGSQSKEIVMYPNSDLATKRIMLLHGEHESESKPERKAETQATSNLRDFVEFNLPPKTTSLQIGSLQDTIERHMEGRVESGVYKNSYFVSLMEFGDNIKMSVDFEHVFSEGDMSEHSESIVMRKKKQRSMLVLRLKKFVEDLGNDVSPS